MSAGKHHEYVDTSQDGKAYAAFLGLVGCREGIDARGARVLAELESPLAPQGRLNVGEKFFHPLNYFVGDLTDFGFKDEHAWGVTEFCGGYSSKYRIDCVSGATTTMADMWGGS